jgi:hypothetical protein
VENGIVGGVKIRCNYEYDFVSFNDCVGPNHSGHISRRCGNEENVFNRHQLDDIHVHPLVHSLSYRHIESTIPER